MKSCGVKSIIVSLVFFTALPGMAGKSTEKENIRISSTMKDGYYETVAEGTINAPAETLWTVLTDFDHHAEYIPNVTRSRVIKTLGTMSIIDKEVKFAFKRVSMILEAVIVVKNRILRWRQKEGPFPVNRGEYTIEQIDGGRCRVTYRVQVRPNFFVPVWMRKRMAEKNMIQLFKTLERESVKRKSAP